MKKTVTGAMVVKKVCLLAILVLWGILIAGLAGYIEVNYFVLVLLFIACANALSLSGLRKK